MPRLRRKRLMQAPAIRTGNAAADRANDAVRDTVNDLLQRPVAKAAIKADLEWGLNRVDHGMGERPYSFHATCDEPLAVIADAQAENPFPERQLWLRLTGVASCSATVFIY